MIFKPTLHPPPHDKFRIINMKRFGGQNTVGIYSLHHPRCYNTEWPTASRRISEKHILIKYDAISDHSHHNVPSVFQDG